MLSRGKFYQYIIFFLFLIFQASVMAQEAGVTEKYNTALNQAEKLYFEKKYAEAKTAFKQALEIKPNEKHPVSRISEINKILGIADEGQGNFADIIAKADQLFEQEKYEEALEAYKNANRIDPDNVHAADRVLEVHTLIKRDKNLSAEYNDLVENGDRYLEMNDFEKAKESYSEALLLKPDEGYPLRKISEINEYLEVVKNYDAAIEEADALYVEKKYDEAIVAYTNAGKIKPDEDYPANMISRIEDLFAELEERYQAAVEEGDNLFDQEQLDHALTAYKKAMELKPGEDYPKSMVTMINGMIQGEAEANAKYNQLIAKGDEHLADLNYLEAQMSYEGASELKPEEAYPKEKLDEIALEMAKIEAIEEEFQTIIARADDYFDAGEYDQATAEYNNALEVKDEDAYALSRIADIEKVKAEIAATQQAFDEAITKADSFFENEDYESAKNEFQKATDLKPDETYPQDKLAEIAIILSEFAETNAAYDAAIASADQFFEAADYEAAKAEYEKAAGLKPEETYPQTKLTEITTILAGVAETNAAYNAAITSADQFFEVEDYEAAKIEYEKAAGLKPEETYPQTKLTEINALLAGIAETNTAYDAAITSADQFFEATDYVAAKAEYEKAAGLKPEETYPQTKLTEVNALLAGIAETNAAYDAAISSADQYFEAEEFEAAKTEYEIAAGLKPEESYPQTKLTEITTLLASIAETNAAYDATITSADQLFEAEDYEAAKVEYEKATGLKPEETYPQTRLTEITTILAGVAETNAAYDAAITSADQLFEAEDYEAAKTEYEKAAGLKPEETYPQTRLTEITALLAGIAETNAAYDAAIASADQLFEAADYEAAKAEYEKAAGLKPEETYPQTRLTEITALLAGIAETNAAYDAAIASADQLFEAADYEAAKAEYEKAAGLKPEETYPQTKLTEITTILAGIAETNTAYDAAITSADQLFEAADYEAAKAEYEKAAGLKPEETYPQTKLTEITTILAGIAETNTAYDAAIASADQYFEAEDYESAKAEYEKAAGLKPEETYPQTRLTEITALLAGIAETNAAYDAAITSANQLFEAEDYEAAKTEYEKAAGLKPEDTYPQTKLTEITTILAGVAETNAAYDAAIASADQFFEAADYEAAKTEYEKAAGLKPEETYPQTKLTEITTILAGVAETNAAYDAAITSADQLFEAADYEAAKAEYEKAAGLKPEETYPQTKLTEITTILAGIAETNTAYDAAIASADQYFEAEDYESAKTEYEKAAGLKPEETYPQTKITEITTILDGVAETNAAYDAAITSANQLFEAEDYEAAKTEYEKAAGLKPEETYPQTRLTEITALLAGIAETNAAYDAAIASADQLFEAEDYESAKAEYEKAAGLKPEETYPQTKLAEITTILDGVAETNAAYDAAITSANQLFEAEDYEAAKTEYEKAAGLKPEETYPQTRLTEITALLAGIAETNAAYDAAIASADQLFEAEEFEAAKTEYEIAAGLKPEESYPQTKLTEITTLLASIAETNAAYDATITSADQLFEAEDYEAAKVEYEKATGLKPEETYPQTRLTEITTILAGVAETNAAYDAAITSADQLFEAEDYEAAKAEYEKAAGLKPEETYPQTRLTEITTILAGVAETNAAYDAAITSADQLLEAEDYESAKTEYEKAAGLKPEETYPQSKLTEITTILAGVAETNAAYDAAIASADQLFEAADYEAAKAEYEKAAGLKPEETYPQTKLTEITALLAGIAETNAAYDAAIASADQLFEAADYEAAKTEYEKAAGLKPEETYPQTKLTEITTILAGVAETNAAYDAAITSADQLFEAEDYESAKAEYEKAAGLKPEETYPQTKLTEITALLAGIAETNAAYDAAITSADQYFEIEDYEAAKAEYEKAAELKPEETYPQSKLTEITALLAGIAQTNAAYDAAIASADQLFEAADYETAKAEYEKAAGLKPEETYPQERISETNIKIAAIAEELAQKQNQYDDLVSAGDFQFDADNYQKAKASYKEALALFPEESYPQEKIDEIEDILAAEYEKAKQEYNRLIKEADRYFGQKIYDNAISYYMSAAKVLPEETYPEEQIRAIRKTIEENVVVNVVKSRENIDNNVLKQFDYEPVPRVGRKESYIVVKARNLSDREFRLFLNYGKDGQKNGGFVINIPEESGIRDYIVKVGGQYKWVSENNNWISLQPEGGDVEVSFIQISQE